MDKDMEQLLNMIGLAKRAGKLHQGFDSSVTVIKRGVASSVYLTEDVSAKTKKEIYFHVNNKQIKIINLPIDKQGISKMLKKEVAVFALSDVNFSRRIDELTEAILRRKRDV